ncbi:MAG TPA: SRPBCC domain-containing protein [Micromonosporaceae bacterium]|nr:SRPBCC domain-containing protein [Micromonosporaceae bacterium]
MTPRRCEQTCGSGAVRHRRPGRRHGAEDETLVTLHLVPAGDGTELTLAHERFGADADRDAHAQGWSVCLDRLPDGLRTLAPSRSRGTDPRPRYFRIPGAQRWS